MFMLLGKPLVKPLELVPGKQPWFRSMGKEDRNRRNGMYVYAFRRATCKATGYSAR